MKPRPDTTSNKTSVRVTLTLTLTDGTTHATTRDVSSWEEACLAVRETTPANDDGNTSMEGEGWLVCVPNRMVRSLSVEQVAP